MKKTICILMVFMLCMFTACENGNNESTDRVGQDITAESTDGMENGDNTEEKNEKADDGSYADSDIADDVQPEETKQETTQQPDDVHDTSYTIKLNGQTSVYSGPGIEYPFVQSVGEDGTYTIVEEATDSSGKLWGRLKSGVGWVNISDKDANHAEKSQVKAYIAGDVTGDDYYERYTADDSEYTVNIAFKADNALRDIRFTSLDLNEGGYTVAETLYKLSELPKEEVLVLGVVFYGDTTTYGFEFTDVNNQTRRFSVFMNGGLAFVEE